MPLYEGIGLISEKHAVVLDIGTVYTKAGFAGETGPRCIIPTEILSGKTGKMMKLVNIHFPDDLYKFLVNFIHHLYFKYLLVNPKDRRVVIIESVLSPTLFRETVAKVLFVHFEVSSLLFVPSHLLTLFTLGISSGLVLDMGYRESQIFPIYDGILLLNSGYTLPLAAKAIHSNLENLLLNHASVHFHDRQVLLPEMTASLSKTLLEDITVRLCFATTLERSRQIQDVKRASESVHKFPPSRPPVDYPMDGDKILRIPGTVTEQAVEVLFELDHDMQTIATLVVDTLLSCPVDIRKTLAENIVVTGGTSMLPGFKSRLKSEINHLLDHPQYKDRLAIKVFKFHRPPAKENYTAWLGAAIFGSTDVLTSRSLNKEVYIKQGYVSDWANLNDNNNKSLI
uniref:Actin-related protein 10 n=1 Tax=Strigamia maritima TaxID=126957 RepID=T1JB17_STRMM